MKKFLRFFGVAIMALALWGSVLASCEEIDFWSDSVCVDIIKVDNDVFELDIDSDDYDNYNYATNAYYYVLLPNKKENRRSSGWGMLSPRLGYYGWDFEYDYEDYDGYDNEIRPVKYMLL